MEHSFVLAMLELPTGTRRHIASSRNCFIFYLSMTVTVNYKKQETFAAGKEYYATGARHDPNREGKKTLLAFDPNTNRFAWRYPQDGTSNSWGGVMTTATGLLFFADDAEFFEAVDAKTGQPLWHFNVGQTFHASPMSYSVNDKQYVAIAAGNDLFSFALP